MTDQVPNPEVATLVAALRSDNAELRKYAVLEIQRLRLLDDDIHKALQDMVARDPDASVQAVAYAALGSLRGREGAAVLSRSQARSVLERLLRFVCFQRFGSLPGNFRDQLCFKYARSHSPWRSITFREPGGVDSLRAATEPA